MHHAGLLDLGLERAEERWEIGGSRFTRMLQADDWVSSYAHETCLLLDTHCPCCN